METTGVTFSATSDSGQSLIDQQRAFTAHLRDPEQAGVPEGVEGRRMKIYRDLVFNNLSSLLAGNFPVLHRLLPRDQWHGLVRDFLRRHRAASPLFPELPREFLDFLSQRQPDDPRDPPFLLELAHYEWIEIALQHSDGEPAPSALIADGDLLENHPVLSPLAWSLSYHFPVHRIGLDFQPQEPSPRPTHLLIYLDPDEQVRFMELNAVTQRLLALLRQTDLSGRQALERIAIELDHGQPEQVIAFGLGLLKELRMRGVILGVLPMPITGRHTFQS